MGICQFVSAFVSLLALRVGEYQIYFIECVENISNFTSAKHE